MTLSPSSPDTRELRHFGFTTGVILVVLFGMLLPWLLEHRFPLWPWIIAAALWIPAALAPGWLHPIHKGWMKFGHVIGLINTRIILALMFYVMILPIGLIIRITRKDPMHRSLDDKLASYRIRSKPYARENMEKPF